LAAGLGIMEVCSSNEMGAPKPRIRGQETTQPNQPKQTGISPGKRTSLHLAVQSATHPTGAGIYASEGLGGQRLSFRFRIRAP
jgi:hypothetical protein